MENKEILSKIINDAQHLKSILNDYKAKVDLNSKCRLINDVGRFHLATEIIPYLDIKDIINLRSTCKDVNSTINSHVFFISYYKSMNKSKSKTVINDAPPVLKPMNELVDADDIQMQLESVKKVKINIQ